MPADRSGDWWAQARHDLDAARRNAEMGIYDWACFMTHQAAERALKGLAVYYGGDAWGHSVREIGGLLLKDVAVSKDVCDALPALDRFYIPTRYPNSIDSGAPADTYGATDAETALRLCQTVLRFVEGHLPESNPGR